MKIKLWKIWKNIKKKNRYILFRILILEILIMRKFLNFKNGTFKNIISKKISKIRKKRIWQQRIKVETTNIILKKNQYHQKFKKNKVFIRINMARKFQDYMKKFS